MLRSLAERIQGWLKPKPVHIDELESTFDVAPPVMVKPAWRMGANEMRRHYGYPELYEDGQTQVEPMSAGYVVTYVYRAATDRLEVLDRKAVTPDAQERERINKQIAEIDRQRWEQTRGKQAHDAA